MILTNCAACRWLRCGQRFWRVCANSPSVRGLPPGLLFPPAPSFWRPGRLPARVWARAACSAAARQFGSSQPPTKCLHKPARYPAPLRMTLSLDLLGVSKNTGRDRSGTGPFGVDRLAPSPSASTGAPAWRLARQNSTLTTPACRQSISLSPSKTPAATPTCRAVNQLVSPSRTPAAKTT